MSHTKGPWRVKTRTYSITVTGNEHEGVSDVVCQLDPDLVDDAFLIAAAPDLLDVCMEIVRVLEDPRSTASMPNTLRMAKAAIAKAKVCREPDCLSGTATGEI